MVERSGSSQWKGKAGRGEDEEDEEEEEEEEGQAVDMRRSIDSRQHNCVNDVQDQPAATSSRDQRERERECGGC